jgi:hypothetical protein
VTATNGFYLDWVDRDGDPLAARLRALRWAEAPAAVRERCWRRINEQLAEQETDRESQRPSPGESDQCERHPFSRRPATRRRTLAERWPPPCDGRLAPVD